MTESSQKLDQLITALKTLKLTGREIAEILWLVHKRQEYSEAQADPSYPSTKKQPQDSEIETPPIPTDNPISPDTSDTPIAPVYAQTDRQQELQGNILPIKAPDAPSLPQPLKLERALRPLIQRISSDREVVIDEQATAERIAQERIPIPVLKPALEPWLDLALVVDESNSMIFWRQAIEELEKLLRYLGFRDVQTWGLVTREQEKKVYLRRGTGKKVSNHRLCHPSELVDPSGRRLILVVSDCVCDIWRNGQAQSLLKIWVKHSPVAIVQMLPEWLWLRTGLSLGATVQLGSLTPGVANQSLLIKEILLWNDIDFNTGIKVPVLTLEPQVAQTWSEMVAGKSYARAAGFVFPSKFQQIEDFEPETSNNEERVDNFRLSASPIARELASLLSAAPIITLPVVRLIQKTMLSKSQQVHVAEVFLGGILKSRFPIAPETNPDQIEYIFIDEEIRNIFFKATSVKDSAQVLDAISQDFAKRLGKSPKDFEALLKKPGEEIEGFDPKPFALVTAKVLKRLGKDYLPLAEELEKLWKPDNPNQPRLPPPLQTFEFDVATVEVKRSGLFNRSSKVNITRRRHQAQYFTENLPNNLTLEMVAIPGGTFIMGAPETEEGSSDDERPQHEVTVPPFFMGKYTVTQAQWRVVANLPQVNRELEPDPSRFKGENLPVENVSWYDAEEFCARLSVHTKSHYRLPSEAEWEYACRAGTTTPFHFGETITPELANNYWVSTYGSGSKGEYRKKTTPVGSFKIANSFGLFDMHGNVWEWCYDSWHDNYEDAPKDGSAWENEELAAENDNQRFLLRGGSWYDVPWFCRSAGRSLVDADGRDNDIGFRVVVSVART